MRHKKGFIILLLSICIAGFAGVANAETPAADRDIGKGRLQASPNNESNRSLSADVVPNAVTYVEDFADPLGGWTGRWFYQNTNAENFYTAGGSNCDPDYRGNQPDGIWISNDRGCNTLVAQSPVRINFLNQFGDNATSFSLDQFTCITGVTFNIYDKNGALAASDTLPSDCWNWTNYSYPLSNGISAFEYSYTGSQVEGNTSIDNVTLEVGPSWNICLKDVAYPTTYEMNLEPGNVLRGQAFFPSADFPAPLTGYYNNSQKTASFSIGYLVSNATRHYWIELPAKTGYTWGILGTDSSFYDGPRAATLVSCGADSTGAGGGDGSGAPE
ncbi:MAG: hypothetical protein A2W23_08095 [Planctomycetes bacterium RBG_16_43_13]|nr:MAG: hypothetical protein A2W23_08095 [Planctomycetes bacterium RBG_16_43_13]